MPGPAVTLDGDSAGPAPRRVLVLDTAALIAATDSLFALGGLIESDGRALSARGAGEQVDFVLVPEVAQEVRDPRARARLALLSESATVREPSAPAMDAVIRFAKATGDFAALSRVDLKVLGLAWMIETELNGMTNLREAPAEPEFAQTKTVSMQQAILEDDERKRVDAERREKELAETEGWESVVSVKNPGRPREQPREQRVKPKKLRKRRKKKKSSVALGGDSPIDTDPVFSLNDGDVSSKGLEAVANEDSEDCAVEGLTSADQSATVAEVDLPSVPTGLVNDEADALAQTLSAALKCLDDSGEQEIGGKHEDDDEMLSDEDDGVGWINTDNLEEQLARDSGGQDALPDDYTRVGCVTTDFAMQNVLLQMGINLVSVDGRRVIRRVRRYVLRCQSCTEITRELERLFCGRCGNATLTRVTFDVDKNGVARIFLSSKFKPRLRGTIYPIPMPRGGRHNKDLILCEDQIDPVKLRRAAKQRERAAVDVLDPDTFYKFGTKHIQHRPVCCPSSSFLASGNGNVKIQTPQDGRPMQIALFADKIIFLFLLLFTFFFSVSA